MTRIIEKKENNLIHVNVSPQILLAMAIFIIAGGCVFLLIILVGIVVFFNQEKSEIQKKDKVKKMATQYFVSDLPAVPANLTQTVVPITQANIAKLGWMPVLDNDRIIGFRNPKLGQFIHSAVIDGDKSLYDLILWDDGPIGDNGLATPGTVIAPVEKRGDGYYVHCFWQWRPVMSAWVLTLPGGFASFVGESAEAVAKREAMEEGGLSLISTKIMSSSGNRANVRTLVNVGYAEFVQNGKRISEENEKIVGMFAIRIDKFPWTTDRFTNEAVWLAASSLGLVRPTEITSVGGAIAALKEALTKE